MINQRAHVLHETIEQIGSVGKHKMTRATDHLHMQSRWSINQSIIDWLIDPLNNEQSKQPTKVAAVA